MENERSLFHTVDASRTECTVQRRLSRASYRWVPLRRQYRGNLVGLIFRAGSIYTVQQRNATFVTTRQRLLTTHVVLSTLHRRLILPLPSRSFLYLSYRPSSPHSRNKPLEFAIRYAVLSLKPPKRRRETTVDHRQSRLSERLRKRNTWVTFLCPAQVIACLVVRGIG